MRRARRSPNTGETVSVLIPAYNEEKVIALTVERILSSDYRNLEVLVIDDGSADHTAEVVRNRFADEKRVTLISIPNGGKANALNTALRQATGTVVVALDADTQFNADTISRLVRWFADPEIGAVAGNAKVGNRINMITRWQALEYIVAQNLERRALSALDTLTVVPGAVGAWRREALLDMGGFPADTLAEDQDLTIAIQTAGYRVLFDTTAIAWTEAPATFRRPGQAAFPLVVRHLAMPVEIPAHHLQSAFRRVGHGGVAAGLAVPDHPHHPGAGRRSSGGLAAGRAVDRLQAAWLGIHRHRSRS